MIMFCNHKVVQNDDSHLTNYFGCLPDVLKLSTSITRKRMASVMLWLKYVFQAIISCIVLNNNKYVHMYNCLYTMLYYTILHY